MRAGILIVVLIVLMAAVAFTLKTFTKGPLAFAGGRTVALAHYHAADPTGVPQNLANADQVKRGEYLARAADCLVCHTASGGADYAGGLAIPLPFGTLYTTNITPDKDTGIGNYSDQDFLDALRRGRRRDGTHLYPAMPYTSYTYMTDADGLAIKAYLFSLPAVHATAPDNTFAFPFNQRWLMVFWSTLFNADARFAPNSDRSPEWNRGAYIAEALAHCGECHTPRNLGLALDNGKKFAGAVTAGWHAFNITSDQGSGIGGWSDDEVFAYLATGHALGREFQPDGAIRYSRAGQLCAQRSAHRLTRSARDARTAGAGFVEGRRRNAGCARQKDLRRILRELPRLDRRGLDPPLRPGGRGTRGQRSHRHQCRPNRDFRNDAANASRCRVDAGLRQHALRHRDCRGEQLRHGAIRQCAIRHHRQGCGRATKSDGPMM